MNTRVCELLGIEYPVIQGGMAWVATAELAAAVSNAGGLGLIAAGNAPAEIVREQIKKARALTDKPFGVNVMMMSPYAEEVMNMLVEEKPAVVATGAGNPAKYIPALKEAGVKVIPVVASVAVAVKMERSGRSYRRAYDYGACAADCGGCQHSRYCRGRHIRFARNGGGVCARRRGYTGWNALYMLR